jgi:hypothetical protein
MHIVIFNEWNELIKYSLANIAKHLCNLKFVDMENINPQTSYLFNVNLIKRP